MHIYDSTADSSRTSEPYSGAVSPALGWASQGRGLLVVSGHVHCPQSTPSDRAFQRPRAHRKTPNKNRFTSGNAEGASARTIVSVESGSNPLVGGGQPRLPRRRERTVGQAGQKSPRPTGVSGFVQLDSLTIIFDISFSETTNRPNPTVTHLRDHDLDVLEPQEVSTGHAGHDRDLGASARCVWSFLARALRKELRFLSKLPKRGPESSKRIVYSRVGQRLLMSCEGLSSILR